ncbi:hypothetical protein [Paenibacillus odorifer]|uniref:Uncharacterized protein n=1 Tax=Paenibacillus odorifer TaxID=189426 RepID=A0AAD0KPT2_9BACL|nr:hypothetical protein [Paenibacillus odorifer]AWV35183.1 hypothetical protein CD191_22500 [Paenibacillus odorifer]
MSDQEREIRVNLLDGSEVIMNTGDRVLLQASSPGAIPLSVVPETIIDDVLAALEESQQQKVTLKEELEDKINESNEFYKWWQEEVSQRNIYKHELAEAQQTIARKQLYIEKLELSRESAQKAADGISKEKGLELFEARQTIARQREVLEFYANQEHWELPSFGRGQSKVTSDRGSKARELLEEGSDKA